MILSASHTHIIMAVHYFHCFCLLF